MSDQNPSPYDSAPNGQPVPPGPSGPPSYPGYVGDVQPRTPDGATGRPRQVDVSFWLYVLSAALSVGLIVVTFLTQDQVRSQAIAQLKSQHKQVTDEVLNSVVIGGVLIAAVASLLFLIAVLIFAVFMRRGANWARIILLVAAAISIFSAQSGYGVGAARAIVMVVATLLLFVPPGRHYFARAAAARYYGN